MHTDFCAIIYSVYTVLLFLCNISTSSHQVTTLIFPSNSGWPAINEASLALCWFHHLTLTVQYISRQHYVLGLQHIFSSNIKWSFPWERQYQQMEMTAYLNAGIQTEIHWVVPIMKYQRSRKDRHLMFKALLTMNFISGQNKYSSNYRWNLIHCLYHDTFNTFRTAEWGTRSSRVCSCCPRYKAFVPRTLLSLSWKTQWNWNQFQNELPSDEGKELHHFLLHCSDI